MENNNEFMGNEANNYKLRWKWLYKHRWPWQNDDYIHTVHDEIIVFYVYSDAEQHL